MDLLAFNPKAAKATLNYIFSGIDAGTRCERMAASYLQSMAKRHANKIEARKSSITVAAAAVVVFGRELVEPWLDGLFAIETRR